MPQPLIHDKPYSTRHVQPETTKLLGVGALFWALGNLLGEGLMFAGAALCGIHFFRVVFTHKLPSQKLLLYTLLPILYALNFGLSTLRVSNELLGVGAPWNALQIMLFPLAAWTWNRLTSPQKMRVAIGSMGLLFLSAILATIQHETPLNYGALIDTWRPTERVTERSVRGTGYHAGGLLFHRLKYAHTLILLTPVWAILLWNRWPTPKVPKRPVFASITFLFIYSLYCTSARSVWGATAIFSTLFIIYHLSAITKIKPWLPLAGVILLVIPLWATLLNLQWPADRIFAWNTALDLFYENKFFGLGYGGYPSAALALHNGPHIAHPLLHLDAHSLLLQALVEQGLVGILMICGLLYLYNQANRPLTLMQFGVILGGLTLGIFHNLFFHPVVWGAWALALAAAGDITPNHSEDPEFPDSTEIDSPRI